MSHAAVTDIVEIVNYTIGMLLCSFLLFCLIFRTRQNLGTYRFFQITMVAIDVTYTTVQMFIRERLITVNGIFAMMHTSSFGVTLEVLVAYLALYNLTFVMIDCGFLYRMWAVKSPLRVRLFSNPLFVLLLVFIAFLECCLWFVTVYFGLYTTESGRLRLQEVGAIEYGVDTTSHVMIMGDYFMEDGSFNARTVTGVCVLFSVLAVCFGFMIFAISDIIHHLKAYRLVSTNTIRLQRQLFLTLCLQTIIPLFCLYSPCAVTIIFPMLRLDSHWMALGTPLLTSCFLPLDALAVILSTGDYRREFARILRCPCTANVVLVENISLQTVS